MQDELIIVGAGHIGNILSKMAKLLDYRVVIIDVREDYANEERYPEADLIIAGPVDEALRSLDVSSRSNVIIVTHGHMHDKDALREALKMDIRYVGMIGSMSKTRTTYRELMEEGVSKEAIDGVFSPVGLDIGGEKPNEIAISILSELQAVKYNKKSIFMKDGGSEK